MTAEKAREMLLEDERRLKANSGASALVTRGHGHQGTEAGGCQYCGKAGHKEDSCWRKYPELIPDRYKSEEKEATPKKCYYQLVKERIARLEVGRYQKVELWVGLQVSDPKWRCRGGLTSRGSYG